MVKFFFSENKKNFDKVDKASNVLIEEKYIWVLKNIYPLDFTKYLSYSEVQKNSKIVNVADPFKFALEKRSIRASFW